MYYPHKNKIAKKVLDSNKAEHANHPSWARFFKNHPTFAAFLNTPTDYFANDGSITEWFKDAPKTKPEGFARVQREHLAASGMQFESPKDMRARFAIIDSEQVMFMLLDDDKVHPSYDVGVWLSTEFLAQAMEQLFELAWQKFKPVSKR